MIVTIATNDPPPPNLQHRHMNRLEFMQIVADLLSRYPWLHRVFAEAAYPRMGLIITKTERDARKIQSAFDLLDDQLSIRVRCINNNLEGYVADFIVIEPRAKRELKEDQINALSRILPRTKV